MNAVEIRNLSISYGTRRIFERFDLSVARGELLAILGPSGCGKSTLLRAIAGLDAHAPGTIVAHGELGYVFQEPRLLPWRTVEANVAFAARTRAERERVAHVLDVTGLLPARALLPKALSGGMAQRAALARALVREPATLLLDEPLAALDALLRMKLQEALAGILAEVRASCVLVTHDIEEALFLADRIVVLGGSPANVVLEIEIPPATRRDRLADHATTRRALLSALTGVKDAGGNLTGTDGP